MTHHELQARKAIEHACTVNRGNGERLFGDEMLIVGLAPVAALSAMQVRGKVELTQFLVKRIPIRIAQRRRFAAAFARIRIEEHADESQLFDYVLERVEQRIDGPP